MYNSPGQATLTALPNGTTIVVVSRPLFWVHAGLHANVWSGKVNKLQTYPFTITRKDPLEFLISGRGGFIRRLHPYSILN